MRIIIVSPICGAMLAVVKSGLVAAAAFATCNDAGTLTGEAGSDLAAKRPARALKMLRCVMA